MAKRYTTEKQIYLRMYNLSERCYEFLKLANDSINGIRQKEYVQRFKYDPKKESYERVRIVRDSKKLLDMKLIKLNIDEQGIKIYEITQLGRYLFEGLKKEIDKMEE